MSGSYFSFAPAGMDNFFFEEMLEADCVTIITMEAVSVVDSSASILPNHYIVPYIADTANLVTSSYGIRKFLFPSIEDGWSFGWEKWL